MATKQSGGPAEQWLEGTGGRILTRHWRPKGKPRAALVICHGVNSHGGQYLGAGEIFAAKGFAVTVLDLRGRGRSDGRRYYIDHVNEYVSDLSLAIDLAKSHDPDLPCYLLGHSAGGVTSVSYALDYQDRIDGLICESFAYRVYAPNFALTVLKGLSHVLPKLSVLKLPMEAFSRDPEWVAALLADPYCKNETQPVASVAALVRAGDRMNREFNTITLPVLILHGTADKATKVEGSEQFHRDTGSPDKQLILYPDYYHDLLNDIGKAKVFEDIVGWIEKRLPK